MNCLKKLNAISSTKTQPSSWIRKATQTNKIQQIFNATPSTICPLEWLCFFLHPILPKKTRNIIFPCQISISSLAFTSFLPDRPWFGTAKLWICANSTLFREKTLMKRSNWHKTNKTFTKSQINFWFTAKIICSTESAWSASQKNTYNPIARIFLFQKDTHPRSLSNVSQRNNAEILNLREINSW